MAFISLGYFGNRIYQEAASLRVSPRDNVQWTLSRLEVELLRFVVSLSPGDDADLGHVRKRFDVLYSRLEIIKAGRVFEPLRRDPAIRGLIGEFDVFLSDALPIVDGADDELRAGVDDLLAQADALRPIVREVSLNGVAVFAAVADHQRNSFERLLLGTGLFTFGLIVILGMTLYVLIIRNSVAAAKEREAEASSARLQAIVRVALDPIVVANAKGCVIEYNEAAEQVFGYSRKEAIGEDMANLFIPPEMREAHLAGMTRYLADGAPRVVGKGRLVLKAIRKTGEIFPVELAIGEAREGSQGAQIFVGFMRDISRRVAAEKDLLVARDAAMAADRAKSDFVAVMSHEMRTPLNGVLGVLDLLGDTALDDRQSEYVDVATRSGEVLLRHINDVLDITRIEAGRMEFKQEPLEIPTILEEAASVGRPVASARHTRVETRTDLAGGYDGDANRIAQVLLNLVGNAVKFTTSGEITVSAERVGAAAAVDLIEFSVADTGCGIAAEDLNRVFDDFVTLDVDYDREAGGSGLGLAICRRIVTAMGGEIGVESTPGEGSRFWFRVHLQTSQGLRPEVAPALDAGPAPAAPLDVLVVEDNEINRMVANRMLSAAGHSVTEARDGLEGVEAAAAHRFDVILMDISMPRMDGLEATRRIRAGEGLSAATPIIGLTAHASPTEQATFLESGMVKCLTKPLRRDALARTLSEAGEPASRGESSVDETDEENGDENGGPTILDDDVFGDLASTLAPPELREMILKVCAELEAAPAVIAAETAAHDVAAAAHKAAGVAALVGASELHSDLAALEAAAKAG
ncbi:MAG: ATP-binding protein, partial [Pseudomonadota bacterium]